MASANSTKADWAGQGTTRISWTTLSRLHDVPKCAGALELFQGLGWELEVLTYSIPISMVWGYSYLSVLLSVAHPIINTHNLLLSLFFLLLLIFPFACCCSVSKLSLTLCDFVDCSMPGYPVLHYLLELAQTHVHWVSDAIQHFIFCRPLLLLPSVFPSIRVCSNKSALCIRWPKYWSYSFSISPSNEYSVLNSFKMDRFDLLVVQGTLKSLLQHHSSKQLP